MKKFVVLVLTVCMLFSLVAVTSAESDVVVAYLAKNTVDAFHATLNNAAKNALDALVKTERLKAGSFMTVSPIPSLKSI